MPALGPWELLIILLLCGMFIGPLLLVVVLVGRRSGINRKKCPHCAEYIARDARVCRYCGRDVPAA